MKRHRTCSAGAPSIFGENLKKWRLARGLNQKELEEMIGWGCVAKCENGYIELPSLPVIMRIMDALQIPASCLIPWG